jgi:hypothetical protein
MNTQRFITLLAAAATMAGLAGCSKNDETNPTVGRVNVMMTDAPAAYDQVNIVVTGISVHQQGADTTAWETIRSDSVTVDLLTLRNGTIRAVGGANVPSGRYNQIRLLVGAGSTVVVDGTTHPLEIPSNVIRINGNFDVPPGGTIELTLDFDAARSIVNTGSGRYILKPVIRLVVNRSSTTGSITGTLSPDSVAATIYARSGADTLQTATAALNGSFVLATLSPGVYSVTVHPDTAYRDTTIANVTVTSQHTTSLGTIQLTHLPVEAPVVSVRRRR